ncbi:uncharacterized protein N7483_007164 [Penicillium malachiteum]|uniref:uncharacterized protein n=1 Tax=Penicillium malachiteum TaxID=1324776 RepID=UPI002548FDFC|nr:uncharacterized protein N7483_007164 [Penicillium malachiteum]KAJ5725807.1 hypothetical protein N7483_007164 [Penicillium malachiteum]
MSTTVALQARLKELSATLNQVRPLIDQLRNFNPTETGDEGRVELGAEIHAGLKDAEDELELLRIEVEALGTGSDTRRRQSVTTGEKEAEKERVVMMAGRLAEDLKKNRGDFRNAQLQAKRLSELARRKERELLLSRPKSPSERPRQASEKLTQDDLVLNASNDVTAALRRTHNLMQAELSRSQFAQETLEQSTAAISSLSESYTSLDSLLASSRTLANSLLRSQKSDTWYLETAFYILIGTIAWLLFRRIFYGPLWWLVWLPIQFTFRFMFMALGAIGLTNSKSLQPSLSPVAADISATIQANMASVTGGAVPTSDELHTQEEEDRLIDKIGKMVEENEDQKDHDVRIDDILVEEQAEEDDAPRNSKKRMMEGERDVMRDEL